MDAKALGVIQLIGAVIAGYFGIQNKDWGVLALAIVVLIMAHHHFTEKPAKRKR